MWCVVLVVEVLLRALWVVVVLMSPHLLKDSSTNVFRFLDCLNYQITIIRLGCPLSALIERARGRLLRVTRPVGTFTMTLTPLLIPALTHYTIKDRCDSLTRPMNGTR